MHRLLIAAVLIAVLSAPLRAQDPQTGSITAVGGTVILPLANIQSETVQLIGTWSGVAVFDFTADGGQTWWPLIVTNSADGTAIAAVKGNAAVQVQNVGYTHVRVRSLVLNSGTIAVTAMRGFDGPSPNVLQSAIAPPLAPVTSPPPRGLPPALPCNPLLHAAGSC